LDSIANIQTKRKLISNEITCVSSLVFKAIARNDIYKEVTAFAKFWREEQEKKQAQGLRI